VAVFVLLFLMTGSLLVPLSALVMSLLSLAATFGVMTLLFQHGWLAGPLDLLPISGLSPYVFLVVFVFAFAFSTDYEVFLLGRIKEAVNDGAANDVAVRRGLQVNGRIITCAALLMLIVFACFGTARLSDIEQLGVGLFVAVLIDATIVRCLLVPAVMRLCGEANWWAPRPLRRFHARFGLRESQVLTKARRASEADVLLRACVRAGPRPPRPRQLREPGPEPEPRQLVERDEPHTPDPVGVDPLGDTAQLAADAGELERHVDDVRAADGKVVAHVQQSFDAHVEPGLLAHLPYERVAERFAGLDPPAGQRPGSIVDVLVQQQNPPVLDEDPGDTHDDHRGNLPDRRDLGGPFLPA